MCAALPETYEPAGTDENLGDDDPCHNAATEWKRQGADDRTIQTILGHVDRRSVERYARLADSAVVDVLRGAEKVQGARLGR